MGGRSGIEAWAIDAVIAGHLNVNIGRAGKIKKRLCERAVDGVGR